MAPDGFTPDILATFNDSGLPISVPPTGRLAECIRQAKDKLSNAEYDGYEADLAGNAVSKGFAERDSWEASTDLEQAQDEVDRVYNQTFPY